MFQTAETPASRIAGAAALLAEVRRGRRAPLPGLPEALRPLDIAEAEAMQLATYAALGWSIRGWKVGRAQGQPIAAPLPEPALALATEATLHLPVGAGMELEAAFRLTRDLDDAALAALRVADIPAMAELVILFEWVETRFTSRAAATELEKLADCVSNGSCSYGPPTGAWGWADVETLEMRLTVDGIDVAHHVGPHRSMPLEEMILAWRDRCRAIGHAPRAGEVVTLGSQTGLLPVPAAGGLLVGHYAGRGSLACRIAPLGS
jgi:2-keto-4-pentenoate hydratase